MITPEDTANYNRATKYLEKNNYAKAMQFFKRVKSSFKELYVNMGNTYRALGDLDTAVICYNRANDSSIRYHDGRYSESYALALNNLGLAAYAYGNDSVAIELYKRALAIDPVYYDALWNLGNAMLRSGDAEGWKFYEYRFKRNNPVVVDCIHERWDGSSTGRKIVVYTEQGLGDKIMFGRYLGCLTDYFEEVYVVCHPSLDVFYSDYKIIRNGVDAGLDAVGIPLCSLAGIFGVVPCNWLDGKFTGTKYENFSIGCVWSGSTTHVNNRNRSCLPTYFDRFRSLGDCYSLNPGARPPRGIVDISSKSWDGTARTVLGLDVVVSVDTSIVHLCGTLGVPCIMIQPILETDFRWGHGTSCDWYDSVVIVKNDNWETAFNKAVELVKVIKNAQAN